MGYSTNPLFDVACLGHVELLTNRFDESLDFYMRVFGLKLSAQDANSAYLRALQECEFCTLKLTRGEVNGIGHIGYRVASPDALERRVEAIQASGSVIQGWHDGDLSHGRAYRFEDPSGLVFEVYFDTRYHGMTTDVSPALQAEARASGAKAQRQVEYVEHLPENLAWLRRCVLPALVS